MMQRWADEEEQERSRFPRRNNDNNGKRHNDRGGSSNQQDPARKRKPDDTVSTMDRTRVVRRATNRRTSSTRFFITRDVQSTPRATTRCGSARSCANPSSRHLQMLLRKSKTRMTKTTRKTPTGSNSRKCCQCHIWRRSQLLQASPEASTQRNSLS